MALLPSRRILILYGSETGNGQEKAGEIDRMCQRLRFHTELEEMNDVKLNDLLLDYTLVVFVVSTTGQGQFPTNARLFWKSLRRAKLPPNCLSSVRFTTFGLGDSAYHKFNWASRLLHSRLLHLGAQELYSHGEADERHNEGVDSIYQPWVQGLKAYLIATHPLPPSLDAIPDHEPLPTRYSLRKVPGAVNGSSHPAPAIPEAFPEPLCLPVKQGRPARVVHNTRVTPSDHWQDVRLLTLEVSLPTKEPGMAPSLLPGDAVTIYPKNYPGDVQTLIELMDWNDVADETMEFVSEKVPAGMYGEWKATLRELLTHSIDFNAVPTRMFLEKLSQYATNEDQKEKLLELVQPEFAQEFFDFTSRPRRTILEVLAEFWSAKVPFHVVPDLFPVIRGREYSIANGGSNWNVHLMDGVDAVWHDMSTFNVANGGGVFASLTPQLSSTAAGEAIFTVDILAALVEYRTIIRKPRQGLCSRYIRNLPADTPLRVAISRADPPPPQGPFAAKRPLLAIATGTGIAPMRSLIQERKGHAAAAKSLLFFGCRNEKADFYFREEWATTSWLTILPAFSRDQRAGDASQSSGKLYVQHLIRQHARDVCDTLRQNAIICVCGNSGKMPTEVREALCEAVVKGGLCSNSEAAERFLFKNNHADGIFYWEETW